MPGDPEENPEEDQNKPATFAQHFLGRSPRRPARTESQPPSNAAAPQLALFTPVSVTPSVRLPSVAHTALEPHATPSPSASSPRISSPEPPKERRVWRVRDIVADIRQRLELGYLDLWIEGEISNCRPAPSGHLYFTLKDGEAQLPVVLFRRQAQLLRFRPTDGLAILARGRLSVYESRGQLQLIAETLEPRGAGALQLAFEQLKARLLAEGLFDAARKRPLPLYPKCIGVVTSPSGAVVRDIVTVIRRRNACLTILVHPAPVQGPACAPAVVRAIRWFNKHPGKVDLILLARGGGSLEDLAGFNEEAIARAIAASTLPVVSAIGHETDFTIADLAADLRAPTPSAAAELITAAQHRIAERVATLERSVTRAGRYLLLHARQRFARLSAAHVLARVFDSIARRQQRVDDLHHRLELAAGRRAAGRTRRLETLATRLSRQSPHTRLAASAARLATLEARLARARPALSARRHARLAQLSSRLDALSPVAVLARGYALVYGPNGNLLTAAAEVQPGQTIRARLAAGSLAAHITETHNQ